MQHFWRVQVPDPTLVYHDRVRVPSQTVPTQLGYLAGGPARLTNWYVYPIVWAKSIGR